MVACCVRWGIGVVLLSVGALWAAQSVVLMATDRELCTRLAEAVTLSRGGQLQVTGSSVTPVEWQTATLAGAGPKASACSSFERTQVDLNHDGRPDQVIRSRFCMRGTPSDSLYLFPADDQVLTQATWQDLSPLHATRDKIERTGGTYPLTQLPADRGKGELRDVFTMDVIMSAGAAYVLLSSPPFDWIVVGRYLGGATLQDVCYLRQAPSSAP